MVRALLKRRRFRKHHPPAGARPGTLVINQSSPPPRIHLMQYAPGNLREEDVVDVHVVAQRLADAPAGSVTWVDVQGFGDEGVMRQLGDLFKLHPLALEDAVNVPQRPKVEPFEPHCLIIARMSRQLDAALHAEQLSMFVGGAFVLTVQEQYGDVFDAVRGRIRQGGPVFRSSGPEYLAYALLDATIDAYYPILEDFGERLEQLEQEIVTTPRPRQLRVIHDVKEELLMIRRTLWASREVVNTLLRDEVPFFSPRTAVHLRDCYDHCVQLIDVCETCRELAGGLMDMYMSSIANRQNEVMRVLTVTASIFIPLTFLAGIYGMNFEHMPETHYRWAYPTLLVVMTGIALAMVVFCYRRGWLGGKHDAHDRR